MGTIFQNCIVAIPLVAAIILRAASTFPPYYPLKTDIELCWIRINGYERGLPTAAGRELKFKIYKKEIYFASLFCKPFGSAAQAKAMLRFTTPARTSLSISP